jgi:hypothetical protein
MMPSLQKKIREEVFTTADMFGFTAINSWEYKWNKKSIFKLCPSIEAMFFVMPGAGDTYARVDEKWANFINHGRIKEMDGVLAYTPDDINAITHEMGHMLCGLMDEYTFEDFGGFPSWWAYHHVRTYNENCDASPEQKILGTSVDYECKWYDGHPEAGCFPGCNYNNEYYRPINGYGKDGETIPMDPSMMGTRVWVGPGEFGGSSFNQIGYDVCKERLSRYDED